jgi:hypothetical protein
MAINKSKPWPSRQQERTYPVNLCGYAAVLVPSRLVCALTGREPYAVNGWDNLAKTPSLFAGGSGGAGGGLLETAAGGAALPLPDCPSLRGACE